MRKHIPNLFTLANLFMGCLAIVALWKGSPEWVFWLLVLAGLFDLLDGLIARLLGVSGELGKQLDSLADMVSFGVVPGALAFYMMSDHEWNVLPYFGFLLTLSAAYRLARFNIDKSQSKDFRGLATPSMALFVAALPHIELEGRLHLIEDVLKDPVHLLGIVIILSWLMNTNIRLFSAKVNLNQWTQYIWRILFLLISLIFILLWAFAAAPIVLLLYLLFSIIETRRSTT
jgi:CDP-diacylglycerol--serine O-phosphatidyltransferase